MTRPTIKEARLERENQHLREKVEDLEYVIRELRGETERNPVPHIVTPAVYRMICRLVQSAPKTVPKSALIYVSSPRAEVPTCEKVVDVRACTANRKLKEFGISIETDWGVGKYMTTESATRWKALLNSQTEKAA